MSIARAFFAGCLTMAALVTAMSALTAAKTANHAHFDEITVGRINIEEPDGTRRLIISNRAQFPGDFYKGKEGARPDRQNVAGILFVNDEGTENGGLIQNGSEKAGGAVEAGLSLTFDRFRQDQALQLLHFDQDKASQTSIRINDVPSAEVASLVDMKKFVQDAAKLKSEEQKAYWSKLSESGRLSQNRIYIGTTDDRDSAVVLKDSQGRPRMKLLVGATGEPQIQMLNEAGKIVKVVTTTKD